MGDVLQMAFTGEQVRMLTGLSARQLSYWVATEFFRPDLTRRGATHLFTFRDVVGLRAISILRNEHRIPLQELRKVGNWLAQYHHKPWSGLRLFVSGRRVYFSDPDTGVPIGARSPEQAHLPAIELQTIADDTSTLVQSLRRRRAEQYGKIERKRDVARNAPRVSGTRIPTSAIWSFHCAGFMVDQIVREYPTLTEADVRAAIDYEGQHQKKQRAG
jgi:uncharacterized protein (DUF433 family)